LKHAFTVCRVQLRERLLFDLRQGPGRCPVLIADWLNVVCPT
jgi:hypothetical protein